MSNNDSLTFNTTILQIGNNTGLMYPMKLLKNWPQEKKPPITVTLNNYVYRSTIAVMGGKFMISVSVDICSQTSIKGGNQVKVQLQLDTQPKELILLEDFKKSLEGSSEAKIFLNNFPTAKDSVMYRLKIKQKQPGKKGSKKQPRI